MKRYWLLQDRIATSQELRRAGVSSLRAIDLGRCVTVEEARDNVAELMRDEAMQRISRHVASAIAHNVRFACDSGHGARFGLSAGRIEALRRGEHLTLTDSVGTFHIGYSPL